MNENEKQTILIKAKDFLEKELQKTIKIIPKN